MSFYLNFNDGFVLLSEKRAGFEGNRASKPESGPVLKGAGKRFVDGIGIGEDLIARREVAHADDIALDVGCEHLGIAAGWLDEARSEIDPLPTVVGALVARVEYQVLGAVEVALHPSLGQLALPAHVDDARSPGSRA